jgi:hypothetical protein
MAGRLSYLECVSTDDDLPREALALLSNRKILEQTKV